MYAGMEAVEATTSFFMANKDRELVTRYSSAINSTQLKAIIGEDKTLVPTQCPVFETDANGYLMLERVTNQTMWTRDQGYFSVTSPVAGNYYPLASPGAVRLKDYAGMQATSLP